jgi:uncharacterized membrane protein YdjX (TVP38/TMEM64 family)
LTIKPHDFGMRLVFWFLFLGALVLLIWGIWGDDWSARFTWVGSVKYLEDAGPWGWPLGILLLVGDFAFPIPGTIVISAMGYVYGVLLGGVLATVGLMLAGLLGYGVGRICGECRARRWLGSNDYEAGQRLFREGGGWVVALSRAVPILPEVISCMAGLVRMPFKRFVLALSCGCVPMGFVFSAIGSLGKEAPVWTLGLSLVVPGLLWWIASRVVR